MYYTFKCTYCGRAFYTYDNNRTRASVTLYRTVKNHLAEYNEDHKEHEMDDGEQEDSNQIYAEMTESKAPPPGAFKASAHSARPIHSSTSTSTHTGTYSSRITLILLFLLILIIIGLFIFVPGLADYVRDLFPQ